MRLSQNTGHASLCRFGGESLDVSQVGRWFDYHFCIGFAFSCDFLNPDY